MADPYKKVAAWYDRLFGRFNKNLWEIGLSLYPPRTQMRVLDIGCGTGAHLRLYQKAGCDVFGIDLSPSMLKQAQIRLGPSGSLCLANAAQTPLARHSFDLILLSFFLHELAETIRLGVVSDAVSLLKRDGRLVIIDYHTGPIKGAKGWATRFFIVCVEMAAGVKHFSSFLNFLSNKGLVSIISGNSLTMEKQKIVSGGNLAVVVARNALDS
jgi:ubiquinone/menaquinone biosynthesis C-methylase UbiE